MGNFRETNRKAVEDIREHSRETTEVGSDMTDKANEIKSILEGINLQDNEDVNAIKETSGSYQRSFDGAFNEQVETASEQIEQQGEQIQETAGAELENVRSGIESLNRAAGVSEIGRDAAESGRSSLESSAGEYEGIISDAEGVVNETKQEVESQKNNLSNIFG